jgi:STE24 endopeptidase
VRLRSEPTVAPLAIALALAAAGIVATLWRPLAPPLGAVDTALDDFTPAVLATVEAYRGVRWAAAAGNTLLTVLVPFLLVATRRGRGIVARLAGPAPHSPARAALVAAGVLAAISLARLPIALTVGYVREGQWGFRTASLGVWWYDWALAVGGRLLVGAVLAAVFVAVVRRWPRSWHTRLTVVGVAASAALVLIHPLVVQPLTLRTQPLDEGPVRTAVEDVLAAAGEPDVPILVGDASTRTSRVNAFFTGLGPSRRVVLYDTLLELPVEQVRFVVAHELAHREHRDIARSVLLGAAGLLLGLTLLRRVLERPGLAATLQLRGPTDPRVIAFVVMLATVGELAAAPVANLVSRRAEAAADHRALELTDEPATVVATARTFVVRDLSAPDPPVWTQQLWGSHPPPDRRVRAGVAYARRNGLALPDVETLRAAEDAVRHPAVEER